MKEGIKYEFHHMGIPTNEIKGIEIYSPVVKMYTFDNPGSFKIQWHRFENDSPLNKLIQEIPHCAFKVNNLEEAIEGEKVILGPYEPIDGFQVAMINDNGVPIELIETSLTDNEIWSKARNKQGSIYR